MLFGDLKKRKGESGSPNALFVQATQNDNCPWQAHTCLIIDAHNESKAIDYWNIDFGELNEWRRLVRLCTNSCEFEIEIGWQRKHNHSLYAHAVSYLLLRIG